ncbi:hypothetical protein MBLNU459_g3762t1 [Dothideomycetes sp. NU459]
MSFEDSMKKTAAPSDETDIDHVAEGVVAVNASGHAQELERNFSLLSICSVGIVTGNTWAAIGGSIVVALYNGGPPGVLFEFIAVSVFYWMVAACIAELASAVPSSAGVYTWASLTAGSKYSKFVGFLAGWWNFFAWIFGAGSTSAIIANQILAMYGLFHPEYVAQRWHVFIVYFILTWACCAVVLFANRALPTINTIGLFLIVGGCFISIIVCAIMPSTTGAGHATSSAVWKDWDNQTGYSSDGFVFLAGMLNGAFAVGTPDCVSHLAEEIPNPKVNLPKAIGAQMAVGFVTGFFYLVSIMYSINSFEDLLGATYTSPLAEVYRQATNSRGGSLGLLIVILLPTVCNSFAPFSDTLGVISPRWGNPFAATVVCGCISTILGLIYIGSSVAFNAFVGSFVVLTTASYLAAILPHLLGGRKNITPGPFWMPRIVANVFGAIACSYMLVFIVIYCFPYSMPVSAQTMNYTCTITGGLTIIITLFYLKQRNNGFRSPAEVIRSVSFDGTHAIQNLSFVLNKPYDVKFEDRPVPKIESPHDVLVNVKYTGICGSDVHYWTDGAIGDFVVKKPMVLGHESSGVVEEVGSAVTAVQVGDRVTMEPGIPCRRCIRCREGRYNLCVDMRFAATPPYDGTLARYYRLPEDFCYKLPEHVSLEHGALAEPLSVAVHITRQADVKPGQSVVVFGAGPVGLLCMAVAKAFGAAKVVAVDINEERLAFAQGYAATHAFRAQRESAEASAARLIDECGLGLGADAVIDASGAEVCIQTSIHALRTGGTYVQGGMGKSDITFPIMAMCTKELNVKGSFRYGPGDYHLAVELISSGRLSVAELITGQVKFEDAEQAFKDVKAAKGIKILIEGPQ